MFIHCTGLILFSEHKQNSLAFFIKKGKLTIQSITRSYVIASYYKFVQTNLNVLCSQFLTVWRLRAKKWQNLRLIGCILFHRCLTGFPPSLLRVYLSSNTLPSTLNVCSIYTGFTNSIAIDLVNVIRFNR